MRVLIVDDDIATVDVIEKSVNWQNLEIDQVLTAYNISRAKQILTDEEVDIIISDIEMPMGSGLDLLEWYRAQQMEGEFLFLTCHEDFHYATTALEMDAAEYLTKPFDIETMEMALKKVIFTLENKRRMEQKSRYGEWAMKNRRSLQIGFWQRLFEGKIDPDRLEEEMQGRHVQLDNNKQWRLVLSKVIEQGYSGQELDRNLYEFMLENIHSEILCGTPEIDRVVCLNQGNRLVIVAACDEQPEEELILKCRELIQSSEKYGRAKITCCVSHSCTLREMYDTFCRNLELLTEHVAYYGEAFSEDQVGTGQAEMNTVLDLGRMEKLLDERDRNQFLNYIKAILNEKTSEKTLTEQTLRIMRQEIWQVIYSYLTKCGVQASHFLSDDLTAELEEKASLSSTDMVRFVNYLLEKSFSYVEQVQKSGTIIEKINAFIHQHYQEDIGRNEIAGEFYLTPDYLAKMYKKKTGVFLKDYINEYRIERAKELLRSDEMLVSDVASAVGFDNFSYFSTLFKHYTGSTPNEYRKAQMS